MTTPSIDTLDAVIPIAVYDFKRDVNAKGRFNLTAHSGYDIEGVLSYPMAAGDPRKDPYVILDVVIHHSAGRYYTHRLYRSVASAKADGCRRSITSFNFNPRLPHSAYGDFRNYAVLIHLQNDCLTVTFYDTGKETAAALYSLWVNGKLTIRTAKSDMRLIA